MPVDLLPRVPSVASVNSLSPPPPGSPRPSYSSPVQVHEARGDGSRFIFTHTPRRDCSLSSSAIISLLFEGVSSGRPLSSSSSRGIYLHTFLLPCYCFLCVSTYLPGYQSLSPCPRTSHLVFQVLVTDGDQAGAPVPQLIDYLRFAHRFPSPSIIPLPFPYRHVIWLGSPSGLEGPVFGKGREVTVLTAYPGEG